MKQVVQKILKHFAKAVLKKYQPLVIGITGSVGKTSTKEAVFAALTQHKRVRQNIKNYNNEIGLPLTIIGSESPGRSIVGWTLLIFKTLGLLIQTDKNYPEILVLEMGVDRIGDMDYLNSIVSCQIGIITLIGPVHLEYFGTIEKIQKEKGKLIEQLPKDGFAILNYDNEKTRQIKNRSIAKVLTYGFDEKADVRAQEMIFSFDQRGKLRGTSFKITYQGSSVPVSLPNVLGTSAVYAALAGACSGLALGMNLVTISSALKEFKSPRGRMNLITGIKQTMIIDDTYNSSPQAVFAALGVLKEINISESRKRIAVLGDMLELGSYSEEGHQEVGKYLAKLKIDKLITIGECSRDIDRGAKDGSMSEEDIFHFADSESAGKFLQEIIKKGDLILVKGSQGVRTEKIVKEIMAEPLRAKELLVRQDGKWLKR